MLDQLSRTYIAFRAHVLIFTDGSHNIDNFRGFHQPLQANAGKASNE
jgi:hypothetical protein